MLALNQFFLFFIPYCNLDKLIISVEFESLLWFMSVNKYSKTKHNPTKYPYFYDLLKEDEDDKEEFNCWLLEQGDDLL